MRLTGSDIIAEMLVREGVPYAIGIPGHGNLPLVVADFQLESPRALRAVPTSSWHRLRALAEQTGVTMLCFTPAPLIPTAHLRLELKASFPLDALNQNRKTLLENLPFSITRRIGQHPQLAAAS